MRPFATLPADDCTPLLPRADFADAFALDVPEVLDAPEAARRAFTRMPGWISRLTALRNAMVAPFGLKPGAEAAQLPDQKPGQTLVRSLGMFPVLSSTPARVVLGFDDRHLDFRIVVDVRERHAGRRVTVTTLVARHNLFGRLYLAAVMPFHKRIVPAVLAKVAG